MFGRARNHGVSCVLFNAEMYVDFLFQASLLFRLRVKIIFYVLSCCYRGGVASLFNHISCYHKDYAHLIQLCT
jgi:hypothetical protein